jgi:DNA-binding Lrp family transcriptional regulator
MEMLDPIREKIWDKIYIDGQQSIEELAEALQVSVATVRESIDHEWFVVEHGNVRIASTDK